jgi:heme exporter protein D
MLACHDCKKWNREAITVLLLILRVVSKFSQRKEKLKDIRGFS